MRHFTDKYTCADGMITRLSTRGTDDNTPHRRRSVSASSLSKASIFMRHYDRNAALFIFLALAYMTLIFVLSSIPGVPLPEDEGRLYVSLPPTLQNLLHIPLFAVLAWLWQRALWQPVPRARLRDLLAIVITVSYGFLDEWHQSFVPGRTASLTDVAFDTLGAFIGVIVGIQLHGYLRRRFATEH